MTNTIFITGASSGIGEAICLYFSSKGWNCIITGRRIEKLTAIAESCMSTYNNQILPLQLDISKEENIRTVVENLPKEWQTINVLVNNAGTLIGLQSFSQGKIEDWMEMIDTNYKGSLLITKYLSPYLIQSKGHIFFIGSLSAKEYYKNGHVYCSTKHAIDSLSKCIRIDMLPYEVKVTTIHPGYVKTEIPNHIYKYDDPGKKTFLFEGYTPLESEDIASTIYYCSTLPSHVCINELSISSVHQASTFDIYKTY